MVEDIGETTCGQVFAQTWRKSNVLYAMFRTLEKYVYDRNGSKNPLGQTWIQNMASIRQIQNSSTILWNSHSCEPLSIMAIVSPLRGPGRKIEKKKAMTFITNSICSIKHVSAIYSVIFHNTQCFPSAIIKGSIWVGDNGFLLQLSCQQWSKKKVPDWMYKICSLSTKIISMESKYSIIMKSTAHFHIFGYI